VPDIIVNCAGCWYIQEFADLGYDTWEEMIDTNIKGYLYVIGKVIVLQCIFTLQVT
jgi:NADP-dependent 3-hydroxy acid dehydrogenase YdfG